jgi:hypothetical protein
VSRRCAPSPGFVEDGALGSHGPGTLLTVGPLALPGDGAPPPPPPPLDVERSLVLHCWLLLTYKPLLLCGLPRAAGPLCRVVWGRGGGGVCPGGAPLQLSLPSIPVVVCVFVCVWGGGVRVCMHACVPAVGLGAFEATCVCVCHAPFRCHESFLTHRPSVILRPPPTHTPHAHSDLHAPPVIMSSAGLAESCHSVTP